MSAGEETYRRIQALARSAADKTGSPAPTQEYLIRHLLESFLDRPTRTVHADGFVLKGGILLAAYGVRRPTKDADANTIGADVTAESIADVVRDIAAVDASDGVVFDTSTITVQEIRDQAEYPGLRIRVKASIGPWAGTAAWDVSTGDPIIPAPRRVRIERALGDPIDLIGYAPETTIAEKGVTILERGWRAPDGVTTSTSSCSPGGGIDQDELLRSAQAVARYRGVRLEPIASHLVGYGEIGQVKWAAWRGKEKLEAICEENLDDQIALVASFLDPVFARGSDA